MAAGDWHTTGDGYQFQETLPASPLLYDSCSRCGARTLRAGAPSGELAEPVLLKPVRCGDCMRREHGL